MTPICIVVQSVYDHDPRVRRKAEALAAAGYSVDVLALRPSGGRKQYAIGGVTVRTIAIGKMRGSLTRYFFEYAAFFVWALVRVSVQMRRRRYAIIDVNTLPDFLVFAALPAKMMGAKVVLDMHEMTPEFYMSKYGMAETSPVVRLLKHLERISCTFADHVITISEPVTDLFVGRGLDPKKATVMMNAADDARFESSGRRRTLRRDAPTFVMMYHGTLTGIYGLDIAIEALALAKADLPGAEFWILGSGPEAGPLQTLARERGLESTVRFIGQVPAEAVAGWVEQSDIGVLPIRRDVFLDLCFPNKLPEYIIAGKPVVIARLAAIRHYFGDDALAFFEPHAAADLARQMTLLYREPDRREQLAAKARDAYEPIRWEVMKQRYLTLVGRLAGARAAASEAPAVEKPVTAS